MLVASVIDFFKVTINFVGTIVLYQILYCILKSNVASPTKLD